MSNVGSDWRTLELMLQDEYPDAMEGHQGAGICGDLASVLVIVLINTLCTLLSASSEVAYVNGVFKDPLFICKVGCLHCLDCFCFLCLGKRKE